jgi:hypothetical protein
MLTKPKPTISPLASFDEESCECVLSETYKCAIRDAIPSTVCPLDSFWGVVTDIVSKFKIMEKCHANQRAAADEIKRWQKIADLLAGAKPTDNVRAMVEIAEAKLTAYRLVVGDFKGTKNPNREALYMWVIEDLWCKGLGQGLGVSSVRKKVPGPLIKFFTVCVNPLLPKPLTASGVVAIHDRVKARRKRLQNWRAKRAKDQT